MSFTLDNPILNSPYRMPDRHWELDERGMPTGRDAPGRRRSEYVQPIAEPRRTGQQGELVYSDVEGREARRANDLINEIRSQVDNWRAASETPIGVTHETARLLKHWRDSAHERPLFFCQLEAVETAIWLAEVADKAPRDERKTKESLYRFVRTLREKNEEANRGLFRIAMKLATGAGKTTVMAMLIAWQAINRARRPNSKLYSDAFLIVAPGITIKDRLRVLRPEAPDSIYDRQPIVPRDMMDDLRKARIVITNYHAFKRRSKVQIAAGTKDVLRGRESPEEFDDRFRETEGEMVQRVAGSLMGRRNIVVLNDEAHHCYQRKPDADDTVIRSEDETVGEAQEDAERNNDAARVWINGLHTVEKVLGIRQVYDLSATPFFLRGSGYREGELFPWVVSDFSLIDAIEAGIVKVPRVPTHDDVVQRDEPVFRNLYRHVRADLSRRGRRAGGAMAAGLMPAHLEAALRALYRDYVKTDERWKDRAETPPVFIVVCNNTTTSKLVFDWIAGTCRNPEADEADQQWTAGNLEMFSNTVDGKPLSRPRTILIDSAQLESGEGITGAFKDAARSEIDTFKRELRQRDNSIDADKISDEDILREVMNTVGRKGKLGERVRCVVSVSMLTEGWDVNTVTHVLGCRAFGTQLLCEQVVGRALRRVSYEPNEEKKFRPEYAEVLGVPFSFMPANSAKDFEPPKDRTRIHAIPTRPAPEIKFPRLAGYRVEFPKGKLVADFRPESHMTLSLAWPNIPETIIVDPLVGASNQLSLDELNDIREQTIAFMLAKRTLERWSVLAGGTDTPPVTLFPQFLSVAKSWLRECLHLKDGRKVGFIALAAIRDEAVNRMINACAPALETAGREKIRPILYPDATGSSRFVDFHTTRTTLYITDPAKTQVNRVLWESTWEVAFAERIERLDRVRGYVKNNGLGFELPYAFMGDERLYRPDFIVQVDDGRADPLNVVVEIKGFRGPDAEAKRDTLDRLWLPAVNNDGRWGRWGSAEIVAPDGMTEAFVEQAWKDEKKAADALAYIEAGLVAINRGAADTRDAAA